MAASSGAELLPRQLFLPPPPMAPAAPQVDVAFLALQFPDQRTGQLWQLGGWIPVAPKHAFRIAVDYAVVESNENLRSGGGPFSAQWAARWAEKSWPAISTDVLFRAPNGDPDLHPLSAKASSIEGCLRLGIVRPANAALWLGYFARRVSPPADDDWGDDLFPSGSGVDLIGQFERGWMRGGLELRQPLAGLPESTWLRGSLKLALAGELLLNISAMFSLGPQADRQLESGWQLGLSWLPPPGQPEKEKASALESRGSASLSSLPAPVTPR